MPGIAGQRGIGAQCNNTNLGSWGRMAVQYESIVRLPSKTIC